MAGEGSGDAMAAPVVERLGVSSFGLGGPALAKAGTELLSDIASTSAMGIGAVLLRAPALVNAARRVLAATRDKTPRAALLVGFSEFNARLGPMLESRGVRVLWYAPPQIWAWRPGRGPALKNACEKMAVVLPFEEQLWRSYGAQATYVGHPALEHPELGRDETRDRLGLTPYADMVALLPGSRAHEVRHHLAPMLGAVALLRAERGAIDARVVIAPGLPARARAAISAEAAAAGVGTVEARAPDVLPAFDIALAASGTVTLECAIAGVPPVIAWRAGRLTEALANRWVQTPHVGLPNVVLGELVFPELLGPALSADSLADEACRLLDSKADWVARCRDVVSALERPLTGAAPPSARVAGMLEPWLS